MVQAINIVTGVVPYREFLADLAGSYRSPDGTDHEAEDDRQAFRRFPFKVLAQNYGGQPVMILDDYRPKDLIFGFGSRTSVWRAFDTLGGRARGVQKEHRERVG